MHARLLRRRRGVVCQVCPVNLRWSCSGLLTVGMRRSDQTLLIKGIAYVFHLIVQVRHAGLAHFAADDVSTREIPGVWKHSLGRFAE